MKHLLLVVFLLGICHAAMHAEDLAPAQRAEYEKTIQIYTSSVIPSNPKEARSYTIRGAAYCSLGQYDLALADFSQAVRCAPGFSDHYRNRADAYEALGQYDKAREDLDMAVHLSPQRAALYVNRGRIFHALGKYEDALGDFNTAFRLGPQPAPAYLGRARTLWALEQYPQSGQDYERAFTLDPRNPYACHVLAWFLVNCPVEKLRDEARAVQLAQRACSLLPNNAAYRQTLESAQAALKKRTEPKKDEFKPLEDLLKKNGK